MKRRTLLKWMFGAVGLILTGSVGAKGTELPGDAFVMEDLLTLETMNEAMPPHTVYVVFSGWGWEWETSAIGSGAGSVRRGVAVSEGRTVGTGRTDDWPVGG